MSNIDKQALREVAEKALPAMQRLLMMPNDELFDEAVLNVDGDVDAANAFNLSFGPETALALLDELDSADGYASAYEAEKWHYHGLAESEGERADRAEKQVEELTMWVKRLAHSLRNARPNSKLHGAAMDYLSRKGLISVEDILR
ncbi:ead/Ea22-like family protein [Salmonella enterica subsp. salamae]|nr:ead/Ea22-like family protein [Salmonella enterica subsp. salamae]